MHLATHREKQDMPINKIQPKKTFTFTVMLNNSWFPKGDIIVWKTYSSSLKNATFLQYFYLQNH